MKPHQNIFFYYRGPRSTREDVHFDLQLENNTTKALINLLEHGGPVIRGAFLRLIDPRLATPGALRRTRVRLQTEASMLSAVDRRWLVTITADEGAIDEGLASAHTRGVPDALVYSLPHFGIIIESKVSATLTEHQLNRHVSGAAWPDYRRRDLTWSDLYESLRRLDRLNELDRFLVNQFLEYLEVIAVAPFTGFNQHDFEFLIGEEEDYRPVLRAKLKQFGEIVYRSLPRRIRDRYGGERHVGRVARGSDRSAWVAFRPIRLRSDPFRNCNFTIELWEPSLSFNAVIRDGRATDKRKPIGVFHTRLSTSTDALTEYLGSLGSEFKLMVYSREGPDGGRIRPGNEIWRLKYTQTLDRVIPETARMLIGLLSPMPPGIPLPGIHLRRELLRSEVLSMSPDELLNEGVEAISRMYPFLNFLEDGRPSTLRARAGPRGR